jgi:hypothetical protein
LLHDMAGELPTPAASHLFQINDDADKLDEDTAQFFHYNFARLPFLCKQARPNVQTAVAFLCNRVKAPGIDDYKKLARTMRYLRGTTNEPLTLEAGNVHVIK